MKSDQEVTNDCVAVAFYGIQANATTLKSCYVNLIEWFESVECTPNKLAVDGPGFSGKPIEFAGVNSRLYQKGFSEIDFISAYSMLPTGELPTVHWWATAAVRLDNKSYFFVQARSSVTSLGDDPLKRLIESCIANLNPAYGIAYHRNHDKGPGLYAIGLNFSTLDNVGVDDNEQEEAAVSKWGQWAMADEVYRDGILRDVYPYNYLTESHLSMRVGKQTLKQWITADESRGTMRKIGEHMTLWQVEQPQINTIRDILFNAGIIFDWKAYLEKLKKA